MPYENEKVTRSSSRFLNGLLIFLLIAIAIIIAIIVFNAFQNGNINKRADQAMQEFDEVTENNSEVIHRVQRGKESDEIEASDSRTVFTENMNNNGSGNSNTNSRKAKLTNAKRVSYEGFDMVGTIRIPSINVKYPILTPLTNKSLAKSVAMLETTNGVNEVGNTTIFGHNYRNNMFFSKLDRLKVGDRIYVKDLSGREVEYEVYEGRMREPSDGSYIRRDTSGNAEISLSTCNDDSSLRYVILARKISEK